MMFSQPTLHPPVIKSAAHKTDIAARIATLRATRQVVEAAVSPAGAVRIPLTTVSLNSNFDAYINVTFKGAAAESTFPAVVDSGNTMLIVPRWEDIEALPTWQTDYQVLGQATEPWGCPAKVVRGPISLSTVDGSVYTIQRCVFYACTGDDPNGDRTANFGTGCINPWASSGWNTPKGIGVTLQSPLSYDAARPYAEFDYAAAASVIGPASVPTTAIGSFLNLFQQAPAGYTALYIAENKQWMSVMPKGLTIGDQRTGWPGSVSSPLAIIDTGGGPIFLSDPNGYVYKTDWPDPAENPDWISSSVACRSTSDAIGVELGDGSNTYSYVLDPSKFPAAAQGLTLVMCKENHYMMGQQGMNTGGITALKNYLLINYKDGKVGFKSK